jgi:hypothetical protein
VEAAGIEPSDDFDATENGACGCENCQQCRAANALHEECFKLRFLASLDAELQCVVGAWTGLATPLRSAVLALVTGELSKA